MRALLRPICWLITGHDWHNDRIFPVHGYFDTPNEGSYCTRCGERYE